MHKTIPERLPSMCNEVAKVFFRSAWVVDVEDCTVGHFLASL